MSDPKIGTLWVSRFTGVVVRIADTNELSVMVQHINDVYVTWPWKEFNRRYEPVTPSSATTKVSEVHPAPKRASHNRRVSLDQAGNEDFSQD